MTTPFRGRDPVRIGAVGLLLICLALVTGVRARDLPFVGGDTYYAEFADLGGLKLDDPVLVAGVRVGKVTEVALVDARVRVGFDVDGATEFGSETRAVIKVRTLLGAMLLALEPAGQGELEEGDVIPLSRTTAPYDVVAAFSGLSERAGAIDTDQLAASLTMLADLTRNTPEKFRAALRGVSGLARTVATRDAQLERLLRDVARVSRVLASRDDDIVSLMRDADGLFRALLGRRAAIHKLFVATADMSRELTELIGEAQADVAPALKHLDSVLAVLKKNEDNIDASLRTFAPFARVFASVTGNGPWLDGYIFNLPPLPAASRD
ncbi:MCE family protein [Nocardioides sp. R1-1]|uniref:MCE family protein n=1 Tax=Nocardioides sp. R1-1 TaxID=3383502 RepID=UPI0038D18BC3